MVNMKKNIYKSIITEGDKQKIEKTIFEIEKKTAGEIVVVFTKQSDDYRIAQTVISRVLAALFAITVSYYLPEILLNVIKFKEDTIVSFLKYPFLLKEELRYIFTIGLWFFIPVYLFFYFSFKYLFNSYLSLISALIPESQKLFAVKEKAIKEFYKHKLYKTRDETGVLFLISIFEKKVYILADRGIYEKITQETLDKYARDVASGIKEKRTADALVATIKSLGAVLEENFPIKPDDKNELPNAVIFE